MTRGRTVVDHVARILEACLFFALACSFAAALANDRTIAQFAHTAWGPKDGAPSAIKALAQSADGYLWLGSRTDGLYRFDGVVFERYQPQSGGPFPSVAVQSLLALSNGDLWIGFRSGEISLLRNGRATNFTTRDGVPGGIVWGFAQDRQGTLWAATETGLARLESGRWKDVGEEWNFPGKAAHALFVDRQGTLWVATEHTVAFLPSGAKTFQPTDSQVGQVYQFAQAASGKLWMAETSRSVRPVPLSDKLRPPDETEIQVGSAGILFDNDGALWTTSLGDGLRRSPAPELLKGQIKEFSTAVESFTAADGLSDDLAGAILQDREGNIWVGTNNGLDRFNKTNLVPVVLPFKSRFAVLAAGDAGDVWVESVNSIVRVQRERAGGPHQDPSEVFQGGQGRWPPAVPRNLLSSQRETPKVLKPSASKIVSGAADNDAVHAYRDPAGAIWWLCQSEIYRYHAGSYTRVALPRPIVHAVSATEDGSGVLWLAAVQEGLFYWKAGVWHRLDAASEFTKFLPVTAFKDWMGRAWFGYQNGTIILVKDENIQKVFPAKASPVGGIEAINGRGRHTWVGGEGGLAVFDGTRFLPIIPADTEAFGVVMGVEETPDGSLWLAASRGVIQVAASEVRQALENPSYRVKFLMLDPVNGLPGPFAGSQVRPHMIQGTDGRLWFHGSNGIVWIDPANITTNTLPPPVVIRSLSTNDRQFGSAENLVLPPRTTNLQIGYTALSLAAPEKVRFRYLLEGVDKDWQDAGTRREAFYTRLGPGEYHFRVVACNNDGVWNETGASLIFSIAPAYYQTNWFRALYVAVFLALLWAAYQLRIRQLQRQFAIGLEARVNERTRIARELHDTLLQTFHGALFQFQAARNLMHRQPDEAMRSLDDAITETKKALAESREAIQDLRSEPIAKGNLPELLMLTSRDLKDSHANEHPPVFDLIEEGDRKTLSSTVSSDICRIALELIRNAYQHAHATRIEAELRYGDSTFRLRIRDDGGGIDPKVLKEGGRIGHWGLPGVRERVQRIGASLDMWSEPGGGTEAQLLVPAEIAYENIPDSYRAKLVRKVKSRVQRS